MPLITIHTNSEEQNNLLARNPEGASLGLEELKVFAAKELSGSSRTLAPDEISVRVITSNLSQSIADIEVVIIVYSYPERVEKQDQICLAFKKFVEERCRPYTVYVWLQLFELGHSA